MSDEPVRIVGTAGGAEQGGQTKRKRSLVERVVHEAKRLAAEKAAAMTTPTSMNTIHGRCDFSSSSCPKVSARSGADSTLAAKNALAAAVGAATGLTGTGGGVATAAMRGVSTFGAIGEAGALIEAAYGVAGAADAEGGVEIFAGSAG